MMKISLICAILGLCLAFTSCNTIAGIGDDISSGGRAINNAAVSTQEKM